MTEHEMLEELYRIKAASPLVVDATRTALVVVDAQCFFSQPGFAFAQTFEKLVPGSTAGYFRRIDAFVMPCIQRLLEGFRAQKQPVLYLTVNCWTEEGRDLPLWMREFDELSLALNGCRVCPTADDPSGRIDERVLARVGDLVLPKSSSGPLTSTSLDQVLRNLNIQSVVVCGPTTAVCVTQTARELADLGYQVIVAEEACTELSEISHKAALFTFGLTFGRVRSTDEIEQMITAGDPTNMLMPKSELTHSIR